MDLLKLSLKQYINKPEDHDLSFRIFDLNDAQVAPFFKAHKKEHYCLILPTRGSVKVHIEDFFYELKPGFVSIIFPEQVHYLSDADKNLSGKILLFDEVLFCSDILNNELNLYNVNLSSKLGYVHLAQQESQRALQHLEAIRQIYIAPTLLKKEQARFYIKILLLDIIEALHGKIFITHHETDKSTYVQFKKLLNSDYKENRTVKYYADKLSISTKKLNAITKKHCGHTAIDAIHERVLVEIKRQMLYSNLSHKQIALDLGFSAPSALHKFIKAKLHETPTDLQFKLEQMYNT